MDKESTPSANIICSDVRFRAMMNVIAYHVIHSDLFQLVADLQFEDVVGPPSTDVHVSANGDELWTSEVVEGQIVVE